MTQKKSQMDFTQVDISKFSLSKFSPMTHGGGSCWTQDAVFVLPSEVRLAFSIKPAFEGDTSLNLELKVPVDLVPAFNRVDEWAVAQATERRRELFGEDSTFDLRPFYCPLLKASGDEMVFRVKLQGWSDALGAVQLGQAAYDGRKVVRSCSWKAVEDGPANRTKLFVKASENRFTDKISLLDADGTEKRRLVNPGDILTGSHIKLAFKFQKFWTTATGRYGLSCVATAAFSQNDGAGQKQGSNIDANDLAAQMGIEIF